MQIEIDDLISRLQKTEYMRYSTYDKKSSKTEVFSRYEDANLFIAFRGAVTEWLQDHFAANKLELMIANQKNAFLEEMVSKSNFAPFVEKSTDDSMERENG